MATFSWITAGESHGPGVLAVLEGVPKGLALNVQDIDAALARRQRGYGRGKRMQIESDRVSILSGLKQGQTLGSPLTLLVKNNDERIDQYRTLTRPRPGHADFAGALKYGTRDCADVMERASARETAARVAAGAVAAQVLRAVGIEVLALVDSIGPVALDVPRLPLSALRALVLASEIGAGDAAREAEVVRAIDAARNAHDTLGGTFVVRATGCMAGLGSPMQWRERLDGRLAQALLCIQGIKAVEIGAGFAAATLRGSQCHDPIVRDESGALSRTSNNAGGIEGGMSNGMDLVLRAAMKPIPSLPSGLPSVDLLTGAPAIGVYERSDVCSVPAASVVGEAMVALTLLEALAERVTCATMAELIFEVNSMRSKHLGFLALQNPVFGD
ncbi:MAG: chorismate synthase [Planctomycetes bacterium]|nr:chorismate synthase [Planctomycetota bacterium]